MYNNKDFSIVLFGAPGSGKTTIGSQLSESIDNSIFISVGSVMRDDLGMTPPFLDSDRKEVMEYIYEKYTKSKCSVLIIDCNPFPEDMWKWFLHTMNLFNKILYININAPDNVLLRRMQGRGRIDSPDFSHEQRIDYFYKNVKSNIDNILKNNESMSFDNINKEDIVNIINKIKIRLNELINIKSI